MRANLVTCAGKRWTYDRRSGSGWTTSTSSASEVNIAITTSGTDQSLTFTFNDTVLSGGTAAVTVPIGRIGNRWNAISISVSSGEPDYVIYNDQPTYADYRVVVPVDMAVTIVGINEAVGDAVTYNQTGNAVIASGQVTKPYTDIIQNAVPAAITFATAPAYFKGATEAISIMYMANPFANLDGSQTIPADEGFLLAALQNSAGYTPPDSC